MKLTTFYFCLASLGGLHFDEDAAKRHWPYDTLILSPPWTEPHCPKLYTALDGHLWLGEWFLAFPVLALWYLRAKQWKKIHFFFYKDKLFFLHPRSISGALCGQEPCSVASSSHRERTGRLHTDESSEAAEGRDEPRQPSQGSVALAAGQAQAVEC